MGSLTSVPSTIAIAVKKVVTIGMTIATMQACIQWRHSRSPSLISIPSTIAIAFKTVATIMMTIATMQVSTGRQCTISTGVLACHRIFQICLTVGDPSGLMRCLHVFVGKTITTTTCDTNTGNPGNQAATIGNQTRNQTWSGIISGIIAIVTMMIGFITMIITPATGWN